jgi:hypothetical protein
MSPWEEMEHFDKPFVTAVDCPQGITIVAGTDPRRVVLQLANPTSMPLYHQVGDALTLLSSSVGALLANSLPPLLFTQQWYGPLVQYQHCIFNPNAAPVTIQVTQILLKDWPSNGSTRMGDPGSGAYYRVRHDPGSVVE